MNLNFFEYQATSPMWPQNQWAEGFWPLLFDQMPYCLLVFDRQGRLILANDEAVKRLDLGNLADFILPEHLKPLKAGAFQLELRSSRSRIVHMPSPADGNPMSFHLRHLPFGEGLILASGHSDTPVSLGPVGGTLDETAAMATEVRRQVTGPLAGIELYASIVGQELEEAGDITLADLIEQIRFGVREVNEYLTSLDTMSEPMIMNISQQRLMDIVDEALGAMNGVFKEHEIGVLVTQKELCVEVDRALMVQLLLNLLLNAVEAMPGGGRIFIEFKAKISSGLLQVIITDTGSGVPVTMMKRIFNPFHTTKSQPLGLGLPVSLRIAEAHQGSLMVGNDLNMGARAVLTLPFVPEDTELGSLN